MGDQVPVAGLSHHHNRADVPGAQSFNDLIAAQSHSIANFARSLPILQLLGVSLLLQ